MTYDETLAALELSPTEGGLAGLTTLGAGYYVAYKQLDSRSTMKGLLVAAPVVGAVIGGKYEHNFSVIFFPLGALATEATGAILGHFFGKDALRGAAAGAVASMLFQTYTALRG